MGRILASRSSQTMGRDGKSRQGVFGRFSSQRWACSTYTSAEHSTSPSLQPDGRGKWVYREFATIPLVFGNS